MADVYNAVYLHLVWATWDRAPKLTPDVRDVAYAQIRKAAEESGCPVFAIGGIEDHVHLLVRFHTDISIAELVKQVKGSSSHLINQTFGKEVIGFKWQGGYGVFPVMPSAIEKVRTYIFHQEEHHANATTVATLELTAAI